MNVEVIKDVGSLSIRWTNDAGDMWTIWTVTKRFDPDTRAMVSTTIDGPAAAVHFDSAADARQGGLALRTAIWIAERMDKVFRQPNDFDRVVIADWHTSGGPAWILPSVDGETISIVTAPPNL